MTTKAEHTEKMLEYLSDPSNEIPTRVLLATEVLGMAQSTQLYATFTLEELEAIEAEALKIRRTKYAPELSKVDRALLKQASKGDTQAAKLCYQRFEGWSEKKELELSTDPKKPLTWDITYHKADVENKK